MAYSLYNTVGYVALGGKSLRGLLISNKKKVISKKV